MPQTQESARLTNMRHCRSQRMTQSRRKSWIRARSVALCVAMERRESIQMRKKW